MTPTLEALYQAFMDLVPPAVPAPASSVSGPVAPASNPAVAIPNPAPAAPAPTAAPAAVEGAAVTVPVPVAKPAVVPVKAEPLPPLRLVDPKAKGWHLDATVAPDKVVEAAELVDRQGFAIDAVTGVDWMAAGEMEVVYDFFHPTSALHVVVRTRVPRSNPELPTISGVFPGANWHERETHDFFGIRFLGHPDLTPLLLPEDADYHPLRKDFAGAA